MPKTLTLAEKKLKLGLEDSDIDLQQIRLRRDRLRLHKYRVTSRPSRTSRGFSTAQALRGLGGAHMQATVRDALAAGMIGCDAEAAAEFRKLTGRSISARRREVM